MIALGHDEFVNGEVCKQASPFLVLECVPGRIAGWFHPDFTGTLRGIANECAVAARLWRIHRILAERPRSPRHLGSLYLTTIPS